MDGTEPSPEMKKGEASRPPPFLRLHFTMSLHFTCNPVGLMGNELLFKDNKSNHKCNCYDHNDQKQDCQSMLLASFI